MDVNNATKGSAVTLSNPILGTSMVPLAMVLMSAGTKSNVRPQASRCPEAHERDIV